MWENVLSDLCTQQRLRSACASIQSDQSLLLSTCGITGYFTIQRLPNIESGQIVQTCRLLQVFTQLIYAKVHFLALWLNWISKWKGRSLNSENEMILLCKLSRAPLEQSSPHISNGQGTLSVLLCYCNRMSAADKRAVYGEPYMARNVIRNRQTHLIIFYHSEITQQIKPFHKQFEKRAIIVHANTEISLHNCTVWSGLSLFLLRLNEQYMVNKKALIRLSGWSDYSGSLLFLNDTRALYRIDNTYSDRQAWAISVDPNQASQNAVW